MLKPKTEVIPFREFVRGEWQPKKPLEIIVEHFDRHKVVYRIAGLTLVVCLTGFDFAHAADSVSAMATDNAIDVKAKMIYDKLIGIGKWVIVFKGGFDTIHQMVQGDMIAARKNFLQYLLIYLILLGLPWCLDQVDGLFATEA